ncbi:hypothetical protein BS614_11710 [Paenibacillus xylanexedens]|uniref:hypothetical protein n=1 Tax=Paenibacillus xylanexedens TaxID=528191 RepID=UPI00093814EC|nr:hypothetical protein [Paenibacillus xylanexedens]APO44597.1 hypothetical protein BS614_11710 [Paenibacillus xylanexedens]
MFSMYEISQEEHEMIIRANDQFGLIFEVCLDAIELSWTFTKNYQISAWIFAGFLSQTNNSLYLAILSLIRRHTVQTSFNLRLSIESAVLACYALYNPKIDSFAIKNDHGSMVERSGVKSKANKWIENNYKDMSDTIHVYKKQINSKFAHSSILSAFGNFELSEEHYQGVSWIFDRTEDRDIHFQLLSLVNLVLIQVEMFYRVIKDYPIVEIVDDFTSRYEKINGTVTLLNDFYKLIAEELAKGEVVEIPILRKLNEEI